MSLPTKQDFLNDSVSEPCAVRLAGLYDIWDKRDPDAETFQFGLRSSELGEEEWKMLLGESEAFARGLIRQGHLLQRYQREQDKSTCKRAHVVHWEGLKFRCLNASGNSLTFDSVDTTEIDALMMWKHDGKKVTVSLYHSKHNTGIDLSPLAVKMGGGGHRGACGFQVSLDQLSQFLQISG